jgi:hypothetical protein
VPYDVARQGEGEQVFRACRGKASNFAKRAKKKIKKLF